ncbi:MAG: TylF/MycF/NovP-related O-methyltransferase [Thermoleophilaceae bacterium]
MAEPEGEFTILRRTTEDQNSARGRLTGELKRSPIPDDEILDQLAVYMSRHAVGRVLFLAELYSRILDVHGSILEFGVRWGRDLAVFQALRTTLEPGNAARQIVGFDTFAGFPALRSEDGSEPIMEPGAYAVSDEYAADLDRIMGLRDGEMGNPYPRRELVRGDVTETLPAWLEEHPETIVALAYLDLDLYEPTRFCLEQLRPYMTKGSVIAFDELALAESPGETVALRDTWGLGSLRLVRTPYLGFPSYAVLD